MTAPTSQTGYVYDPLGRLTTSTDPLGRVTTYGYDAVGNRVSKQDHGGNCGATPRTGCTTMAYDVADQLASITYSDGTTPNVTGVTYDANGRRTAITDGTGSSSWAYDSLGRLTSSTNGTGATGGYGYDVKGQLTSLACPNAVGTVTRGYDAAGRLASVTDWNAKANTFAYDADFNLASATYGNGTAGTFGFDNAGRVLTMTDANGGTTLASLTYTREVSSVGSFTMSGH
jgi:YD repeat-containing protein